MDNYALRKANILRIDEVPGTSAKIEIFPWSANFETGIALIDEQHKQLIQLLNLLVGHLAFQSDAPTTDKIFQQLKDYVEFHFAAEREIWQKHFTGDSWEKWHELAHSNFVAEVIKIKEEDSGRSYDENIECIVKFLTHWLAHHILESDKRMAKVVLALPSGISLTRAKEIANEEMSGATRVLIDTVMSMYDNLANSTVRMSREIYKREQAEAELQRAKEAADAANRAKTQFLANMSHELRTPLNAILGFSQLMVAHQNLTAQQQRNLQIINQSGEDLLTLINEVLDISKIEAGYIKLQPVNFNLPELLNSLAILFQEKLQHKKLTLEFQYPQEIPTYIYADKNRLRQVLVNLIGNAIKFTRDGEITVTIVVESIAENKLKLHFAVADTGRGIPADELAFIFDYFVQSSAQTEIGEGSGLGLSITKHFVELMGGEISAESEINKGSVFKFSILAAKADSETLAIKSETKKIVGLVATAQPYRILVVDDIESNRILLTELLLPLGFEIKEAVNGQQAIATWQAWQPDIVLMDMKMPVMDGYAATTRIKSLIQAHKTVIIAVTGSAFTDNQKDILQAGCDDFVAKPVKIEQLLAVFKKHLPIGYIEKDNSNIKDNALELCALKQLTPGLKQQLVLAISAIDTEKINSLIAIIAEQNVELANALKVEIESFHYDSLLNLLNK